MTLARKLLSFGIIGTFGFMVDVAVLYAVAPLLGWLVGRVISFLAAASTTWWLNRKYTFAGGASQPPLEARRQYARYILVMLGGAALNYASYAATLALVSHSHAPALGVALGSIAGMGINFLSARFLVFGTAR